MALVRIDKKDMSEQDWVSERLKGIGSSDAAEATGYGGFGGTPYKLWLEKTGQNAPADLSENHYVYWGKMHEPTVAREFQIRHPEFAVRNTRFMFMRDDFGFPMLANVDRLARRKGEPSAIVEIKTTGRDEGWGEEGTNQIPDAYFLQTQHQLAVMGDRFERVYVPVLLRGNDYREYIVERDETVIADLVAIERDFWNKVETMTPPDPINMDDVTQRWLTKDTSIEATPEILNLVRRLKRLKQFEKVLDETDEIRTQIGSFMGENGVLTAEGKKLLTFKRQTSKRLDGKALAADHGDLVEQYKRESQSRVLRLA